LKTEVDPPASRFTLPSRRSLPCGFLLGFIRVSNAFPTGAAAAVNSPRFQMGIGNFGMSPFCHERHKLKILFLLRQTQNETAQKTE